MLPSCTKDGLQSDCVEQMLADNNMDNYNGVIDPDCRDYLQLYDWDGDQYFIFENPCEDRILAIFDCGGNNLCTDDPNCSDFFQNAELVGIVGRSR